MATSRSGSPGAGERRRRRLLRSAGALALALTACVAAACGSGTATTGGGASTAPIQSGAGGVRGGSLTMARAIEPTTLDPLSGTSDAGTIQTQIQIFDQLVEVLPGSPDPKPGLAKSWTISPDGLTYTFALRDAQFSNGAPVTASDVQFSLTRLLDPRYDPNFAGMFGFIKRIDAPDPKTVVLHLKAPTPATLAYLSFNVPSIVPKKTYLAMGPQRFAEHPVGSGAFMVKQFVRGQRLELVRNPHYWRTGLPYLDAVTLEYVPDDNTRVLDLRSGSAQVADDIPFSQVASLGDTSGVTTLVRPISAIESVWFNQKSGPLKETAVRRALNLATPKDAIQRAVFAGIAPVANSVLPKIKYWDGSVQPIPYDVAQARAELARSSTPDGFPLELQIVAGDAAAKQIAAILQQAWARVGVRVAIRAVDFGTLNTNLVKGDYQALMFLPTSASSDVPVDDELARGFLVLNDALFTFYRDPQVTKLVEQATSEQDETKRAALFAELQRTALANPNTVPLVFTPGRAAYRDGVKGFEFVTTNWWRLDQVSLER